VKPEHVQQLQVALLSNPRAKLNATLNPMDKMLSRDPREVLARAAYLLTTRLGWAEAEQAGYVIQRLSFEIYIETGLLL
jgi:hypothetical protein